MIGASPKTKWDQQGRAAYQLRDNWKLPAAGRAAGEEGQRGTRLLPGLLQQVPCHGCCLPSWAAINLLIPCSIQGLLDAYRMSSCLGQQVFKQTFVIHIGTAPLHAKLSLTPCHKVILKGNELIYFFVFPPIIFYGAWSTFSVNNVHDILTGFGQPLIQVPCLSQIHMHSQETEICNLQKWFKASFQCSYIRKHYSCPEITKNTLVDKGLEFDSLPERSLYSLFKYLWKKKLHILTVSRAPHRNTVCVIPFLYLSRRRCQLTHW